MQTLVYIPGLGSNKSLKLQRRYVSWRGKRRGWNVVFFEPNWHTDEPYEEKWTRLVKSIKSENNSLITLLAVSAGGSLLVRALAEFPLINYGISLSGAVRGSATIQEKYKTSAPAIYDSIHKSELFADKQDLFVARTTVFRPLFDTVVAPHNMIISGAKLKKVYAVGHSVGIVSALLFNFPKPADF